mmetsp:Transcript_30525/g.101530  ORF Transcript_30525/g.101530 Transcript_30525/m.101530 type:complete len:239 (+) Transcript_30525:1683-2399(+)
MASNGVPDAEERQALGASQAAHGERQSGDDRGDEGPEQSPRREMRAHLLQAEEHAPDGSAEGGAHAGSHCRRVELAALAFVLVLRGEPREQVGPTHGHVHHRALVPQAHARCHGQDQPRHLDAERAGRSYFGQVKPVEDRLHLRDARAAGSRRELHDECRGGRRHGRAEAHGGDEAEDAVTPADPSARGALLLGPPRLGRAKAEAHGRQATDASFYEDVGQEAEEAHCHGQQPALHRP